MYSAARIAQNGSESGHYIYEVYQKITITQVERNGSSSTWQPRRFVRGRLRKLF